MGLSRVSSWPEQSQNEDTRMEVREEGPITCSRKEKQGIVSIAGLSQTKEQV